MKETIGINPLITLLVLAAGTKIGGITGTLLSIPTYLFIETSLKVLNEEKDKLTK
jgi:predicted PurR-regulated permease PerM